VRAFHEEENTKMTRSRLLRFFGTALSGALLASVSLVPSAGASPVTVQDCHSVTLNRTGHVALSLSTNTTGAKSAQADVGLLVALRLCYSLSAEAGVDATPTAPVVTVTPVPPHPDDTTACAEIDLAVQASGKVTGQVTASLAAAAGASATGVPPASASDGTTLSQDISITPPAVGEHVKAKACVSTTGNVSVA
jgi:hypothetical protein